jgi:hypothetical protein
MRKTRARVSFHLLFDCNAQLAPDEVYIHLQTDVVGIKYYRGLVGYGEQVNLVREPTNQYDRNAIRVMNISGKLLTRPSCNP